MARRLLWLAAALIVLSAVVGMGVVGGRDTRRPRQAPSGLVRNQVITRVRVGARAPVLSVALRRQLTRLVRGFRLVGAGGPRVAHAPTAPPVPWQSCAVSRRGCSLRPCVVFAGSTPVILRRAAAVRYAAGCRRPRAGALSIS